MDAVLYAVLGDLTSRFIVDKYQVRDATNANNDISRLQQLLLRASTVETEAEGRRVTNPAMLLQLRQLREAHVPGLLCNGHRHHRNSEDSDEATGNDEQ
jgi:hypothetical protein